MLGFCGCVLLFVWCLYLVWVTVVVALIVVLGVGYFSFVIDVDFSILTLF